MLLFSMSAFDKRLHVLATRVVLYKSKYTS